MSNPYAAKKLRKQLHGKYSKSHGIAFRLTGSTVKGGRGQGSGAKKNLSNQIELNPGFFGQAQRYLEKIIDNITWLESSMAIREMVSQIAGASIAKNFENERSLKGHWKRLVKKTRATRTRQGFLARHPVLQRSGNLYIAATKDLIVNPWSSGNLKIVIEPSVFKPSYYDKRGLTPKAYFLTHNRGRTIDHIKGDCRISIPRRRFFVLRRHDFTVIGDLLLATVLGESQQVAKKRKSNEVYAEFSTAMKEYSLYDQTFKSKGLKNTAGRAALAKVRGSI